MENDNISYNKTSDDMIQPIDTRAKDYAMDADQKKKELYEKMKREVEAAQQANEQFHQQMRKDDMNRPIKDYNINEYGEIERPSRSR
jgi:hypothetical protein